MTFTSIFDNLPILATNSLLYHNGEDSISLSELFDVGPKYPGHNLAYTKSQPRSFNGYGDGSFTKTTHLLLFITGGSQLVLGSRR
jgi:hypothetical protein